MPVFPNYTLNENDEYGRNILGQMEDHWINDSPLNLYFQGQADLDVRAYVGDSTVYNDLYGSEFPNYQTKFTVNLIKRLVEMPVGHQLDHRKSITTIPIEGADQETADQFTKILMWNDRQAMLPDIFSSAFKGACITGLNWVTGYLDYTSDPLSGDFKADVVHYNEVIFDPFFKKLDMSDCNYWWRRSWVGKEHALALLPGYEDLVREQMPRGLQNGIDGKFQYAPQTVFYNNAKLLTYDEYWYRSYRKQKLVVDEENGRFVDFRGSDEDLRDFKEHMEQTQPNNNLRIMENVVPTTRRTTVLNGVLVVDEANPMGIDEYPHVPVMCYYTPESNSLMNRIQGIVRAARDPQFLFNKFLISTMDTIDAQPHSGFIAKEDSVINPKALHKVGPGQVIWRKKHTTIDDIQKIEAPNPPVAQMQMTETLQKLMIDTTGTNETNLGLSDDKVAGVLNMLNQRAGIQTLNSIFDNLDKAMKYFGLIRLKVIQNKWLPQKIERILNEKPSEQFYDRAFGTYDCVVEDGYDTSTQRQLAFAQAIKLKEMVPEIPSSFLVSKSTLQDKNDLVKMLEEQEKAQGQQAQAQAQAAQQEQSAAIGMADAQAAYQRAGSRERDSRIYGNMAEMDEREAEALKDREQAVLNKIKALSELEDLEMDKIEKFLKIAQYIKQMDQVDLDQRSANQQQRVEMIQNATPQPETPPGDGGLQ